MGASKPRHGPAEEFQVWAGGANRAVRTVTGSCDAEDGGLGPEQARCGLCAESQYSLMRHLCWAMLLKYEPRSSWIIPMTEFALYMDDGGHPVDKPYVTIGGYVSTEEKWLKFETEWKHKLDYFGLEYPFHMTDFMAIPMKPVRRNWILGTLATIVEKHTCGRFGSAISMDSYHRVSDLYLLEEMMGAPLAIIAREIARQMNVWKRDNFGADDKMLIFYGKRFDAYW
jgi:hypothetical protein